MKEIQQILRAWSEVKMQGRKAALVTLVHVEGSSYRRPGARMLVTEDGELTGAISGGCLEGDALNKALFAMQQQRNMVVTYDTSDENDAVLGLGLGCNGVIQVLIQPVSRHDPGVMDLLEQTAANSTGAVLATLFSLKDKRADQPGTCCIAKDNNIRFIREPLPSIKDDLQKDIGEVLSQHATLFRNFITASGETIACIEYIPPAISLVIAGTGNDVEPVVSFASILGWQTTVINDGRDKNRKSGRFAGACQLNIPKAGDVFRKVTPDRRTYFLLMTHNYHYDLAMLRQLIQSPVHYIGILGPRKKLNRMLDELRQEGIQIPEERLRAIYSPVGLNIGAETPEEIALSIIAEIQSVVSGRNGEPLKFDEDVIHPRSSTSILTKNIVSEKL